MKTIVFDTVTKRLRKCSIRIRLCGLRDEKSKSESVVTEEFHYFIMIYILSVKRCAMPVVGAWLKDSCVIIQNI